MMISFKTNSSSGPCESENTQFSDSLWSILFESVNVVGCVVFILILRYPTFILVYQGSFPYNVVLVHYTSDSESIPLSSNLHSQIELFLHKTVLDLN